MYGIQGTRVPVEVVRGFLTDDLDLRMICTGDEFEPMDGWRQSLRMKFNPRC